MSQSQAKAARRKITSGYAHLGNALQRPRMPGAKNRTIGESIDRARRLAANQAKASKKKS